MPPRIERYAFGSITIDGVMYDADVIVLPERVVADWWRKEGHSLAIEDLTVVTARRPRILVVGTGAYGLLRVPRDTLATLKSLGMEVAVQRTAEAVATYNRLARGGDVAACLHLTC